jgi:enoyl-CoA hydratase/carnithine racemase
MSYARVGLTPDGGGSWFVARALPRQLATEVLIEGKPIGAARLHELGVVNKLAKPGTARDTAVAWADELGKISPHALARIKGLIGAAGTQPLAEHLVAERDSFVASLHHRDGLEGISAFLEKRAPVYK